MTNRVSGTLLESPFDIRDYKIREDTEFPESFSLDLGIAPNNPHYYD